MYRNNLWRFFAQIWPEKTTSRDGCMLLIDVPSRGAQFAADRIAAIRSDLKSHDSNRNEGLRKLLPATGVIWALRAESCKQSSKMGSRALSAPGPKKSKTESK